MKFCKQCGKQIEDEELCEDCRKLSPDELEEIKNE